MTFYAAAFALFLLASSARGFWRESSARLREVDHPQVVELPGGVRLERHRRGRAAGGATRLARWCQEAWPRLRHRWGRGQVKEARS